MTIFDLRPYSYWKHLWTVAYVNWDTGLGDCPRTVMQVELLTMENDLQRRQIDTLTRENTSLRTQHQHLVAEYMKLLALSSEVAVLIAQIGNAAPDERLRLHPSLSIPTLLE